MSSTTIDRIRGINSGIAIKAPCRVATTANITLSGEQTIDGVAVVADDRVLVKNQTTASQNGIYTASTSTWSRAADFDGSRDVVTGTLVSITAGTTNADTFWTVTTTGTITPGTTSIAFAQRQGDLGDTSAFIEQIQDGGLTWCGTAGGTANALTLTPSPAITAYAAGQRFEFIAGASPNSSTVTVAISGLSTIAVQLGGSALAGGEIQAGKVYRLTLDTTSTAQLEAVSEVQSVATGGTGATSLTANNVILGNGTSAVQFVAPSTSGNILQSNGTTWASVAASFGKVGQVQSTTKTSTTSTTSNSFTDITGMSVSITPTSTSSKVLVVAMVNVGAPVGDGAALKLVRDSTDIGIGDAASNRTRATAGVMSYNADKIGCVPIVFVDSPSTTSATTYKLQWKRRFASGTIYLNRSADDTDSSSYERTASTITAIEILP